MRGRMSRAPRGALTALARGMRRPAPKRRCVGPTSAETREQGAAYRGPPIVAYKAPSLKGGRGACHPRRRGSVHGTAAEDRDLIASPDRR